MEKRDLNTEIYIVKIPENVSEKDIAVLAENLNQEEKARLQKFRFLHDKARFAAGKALTRNVLSQRLKMDSGELIFLKNEYDRPFLLRPKVIDLDFNLSHSGEYVVLIVGNNTVGVDVEKIKPIDPEIINEVFHEKEIETLCPDNKLWLGKFYQIWTLKEAFIKNIGQGLSFPLKSFYVRKSGESYTLSFTDKKVKPVWRLEVYDIDKDYRLAICVRKEADTPKINFVNYKKGLISP